MEETKQVELTPNINNYKGDTSFLINNVEYSEPSEYEKKMLEGTKNPSQLLEEEKNEVPIYPTERKMFIDMVKVISLVENGYTPLDNPSNMYHNEKVKIIKSMEKLITYSYDSIKEQFNNICNEHIFTPKADYSQYPVIPQN
jgi:hypothetical protein